MMNKRLSIFACLWAALLPLAAGAGPTAALEQQPARIVSYATEEMLLAAARADKRIVAVGDRGVVLLSDDGKSFRQAKAVPTRATLNGVSFANGNSGWIVGHWGTILHTEDAGETWKLQRTDTSVDRPLFAVHAFDAQHAVAVGLWSLVLVTQDGGASWHEVKLPSPPEGGKADRNLLGIFSDGKAVYVAAERGMVLRSDDLGANWTYLNTGYNGSFWTGIALKSGVLLVGGMRGTIYRSTDAGKTWQPASTGTKNSITGFAETADGLVAVGLDGLLLRGLDEGKLFAIVPREDHTPLTAVVPNAEGKPLAFSKTGVVVSLMPAAK